MPLTYVLSPLWALKIQNGVADFAHAEGYRYPLFPVLLNYRSPLELPAEVLEHSTAQIPPWGFLIPGWEGDLSIRPVFKLECVRASLGSQAVTL